MTIPDQEAQKPLELECGGSLERFEDVAKGTLEYGMSSLTQKTRMLIKM